MQEKEIEVQCLCGGEDSDNGASAEGELSDNLC